MLWMKQNFQTDEDRECVLQEIFLMSAFNASHIDDEDCNGYGENI